MMNPKISIIIPVYNDSEGIKRTLTCVTEQKFDDYDIHVVNNNSQDDTVESIRSFSDHDPRINIHHEIDMQSAAAARNKGINNTNSNILAFVDSGMKVPPDWLSTGYRTLENTGVDYLCGDVVVESSKNPGLIEKYKIVKSYDAKRHFDESNWGYTGNLFVRREVFEVLGGFDRELVLAEDRIFGQKVHNSAFKMEFNEELKGFHPARKNMSQILTKSIRGGRAKEQIRQKYSDRNNRSLLDPRNVLPPRPFLFVSTLHADRAKFEIYYRHILLFYLIKYIEKLGNFYGSILERQNSSNPS